MCLECWSSIMKQKASPEAREERPRILQALFRYYAVPWAVAVSIKSSSRKNWNVPFPQWKQRPQSKILVHGEISMIMQHRHIFKSEGRVMKEGTTRVLVVVMSASVAQGEYLRQCPGRSDIPSFSDTLLETTCTLVSPRQTTIHLFWQIVHGVVGLR